MEQEKPMSIRNILKHYDHTKRSYRQMEEKQAGYIKNPTEENRQQMNSVIEQLHAYEQKNHIGRNLQELLGELYDTPPDLVRQLKQAAKEKPELLDVVISDRQLKQLDRHIKEHGTLKGDAAVKLLQSRKPDISR